MNLDRGARRVFTRTGQSERVDPAAAPGPALFFSPHLDDAALSAGAALAMRARLGLPTRVTTVFAGDGRPPLSAAAAAFHRACGLSDDDAIVRRRSEDRAALNVLGVESRHLDFPEALYRRDASGEHLYSGSRAQFGAVQHADALRIDELVTALRGEMEECSAQTLCAPIGVGGHVDHILVREAVRRAARGTDVAVHFWVDQPYAVLEGRERVVARASVVEAEDVQLGLRAAACYESQIPMLFETSESPWRELMRGALVGEWCD